MKKLMLAAAVMAAGVAVAETAAPIESEIVGYLTMQLPTGYKMATPCFKNLGTENYPIDNFTVQGSDNTATQIQVLNSDGQVSGAYYWWNADPSDPVTYPAGWFDFGGSEPAGIELKPGEAVYFYTDSTGVTIQSCGQVPGEITNTVFGYTTLGNGSPVELAIDDFTVQGSDNTATQIQILNSNGKVTAVYYWWNADPSDPVTYPAGWFDFGGSEPAGVTLNPGDSVLFYTETAGVTATVPGALAK